MDAQRHAVRYLGAAGLVAVAVALVALAGLLGGSQVSAASLGPNTTGMMLGTVVGVAAPTALPLAAWINFRSGYRGTVWLARTAAATSGTALAALCLGFYLNGGF